MNQIIWSPLAKDTYVQTLQYLIDNWSLDAALRLDDKVNKLSDNLANFKYLCPPSKTQPLLRRCVVSKHNSLVYQIDGNQIYIYTFFDNRAKHLY